MLRSKKFMSNLNFTNLSLQYNVFARDNGTPQLTSNTVTVTINIRRNQFPPVFQNEPYTRAITSSSLAGTSIVTVTATDADTFVSLVNYSDDLFIRTRLFLADIYELTSLMTPAKFWIKEYRSSDR